MEDHKILKMAVEEVPFSEYRKLKKKLIEGCLITPYTFDNWLYGKCRIPELHKCKIEEILGKKIFNTSHHEDK